MPGTSPGMTRSPSSPREPQGKEAAKPFAEALPELAASIRRGRGPNKKLVSLRLSGQVIEKYKAGGPGWQSRIDQDLRVKIR